tara:strand:- start:26 stop:415 length:390 start_codon:yes stop_codon:yes gene_type:complete
MEPPRSITTTVWITLISWVLVTLAVPLVAYIMHLGYSRSGIALAALVTVINVICILKTTLAVRALLGRLLGVTKVLQRVGLGKLTKSGGKASSLSVIYRMVYMNLNGYQSIHFEGSMDEETEARLRGDI